MHRYINGEYAYDVINTIAYYVLLISSLFYYKSKGEVMGLWSKYAIRLASRFSIASGRITKLVLSLVELFLFALLLNYCTYTNMAFGNLVGTGGNYFSTLFLAPIAWSLLSLILGANPLEQIDIATMFVPVYLFFVKLACFYNGCCWGIPWEDGPYNQHPYHPGRQVPVQAIECFWCLVIFAFLLWYRKKAKRGTMYPLYMMLYSATRFCSEFFRHEENVLWIFKTYHLLCIAGFLIGLLFYFFAVKFGDRMFSFIDKLHKKFDGTIATTEAGHKTEHETMAIEKARIDEMKRKQKEREKKNKKLYSHSRKL